MLSEETAVGLYPTDTVRTMAEVAEAAECWPGARIDPAGAAAANDDDRVAWAVAHAAVQAAEDLGVGAIVCPTQSGTTARRVAAFRPTVPIVGSSDQPEALGGLSLVWGVRPLTVESSASSKAAIEDVLRATRDAGIVRAGELVAVVSASKGKRAGSTDTVRVVRA
jgi:pyruvate kinase